MKAQQIITEIRDNGGLDIRYMRSSYYDDKRNRRVKNKTFKSYVAGYIQNYYYCSRYVATKVAEYYV